jgi:HAD superfamily hydrolase (TIGR01549 family)
LTACKIKAVLFDLGETLLNFGRVNTTALFKEAGTVSYNYLKQHGQPVGNFKSYLWGNLLRLHFRRLLANITGNDFDSFEAIKSRGIKMGYELTDRQWEHVSWLWYEPLYHKASTEPDITDTLNKLTQAGLKLGIISNTFVNACSLDKHLAKEGLLDFFEIRLYSYQFTFRKPDRRIFLEAARQLDEHPENIVYVGDRLDKDIRGALKAGMHPVLKKAFTNNGKKPPEGTMSVEKISELPGLIANINNQK